MAEQINIEYFFRLLYELFFGANGGIDLSGLQALIAKVWTVIVVVGYLLSIIGFFIIVYVTLKLFELRRREEEYYTTVIGGAPQAPDQNPRWQHIQMLLEGGSASGWREAITEADILLDDVLSQRGYVGDSVGDKLKQVDRGDLSALDDAWEAHKIRNRIAHDGSAFELSETLAHRTIQRYEAVFREWRAL